MSILNTAHLVNKKNQRIFGGQYSGFQRFDVYQYAFAQKIEEKMRNAFWNPEEVSLSNDSLKFKKIKPELQEVFVNNLLYQTLMDSVQSRGLEILTASTTLPEFEAVFRTQSFFEQIHSNTYSHIIRGIFPEPSKIFDKIEDYPEIKKRLDVELAAYDALGKLSLNDMTTYTDEDKMTILRLLLNVLALESIKFKVSFLTTYLINDSTNCIAGTTRLIKLINFDENIHVSVFTGILSILAKNKSEGFSELMKTDAYKKMASDIFVDVFNDELSWFTYLNEICPIPGLSTSVIKNFLEFYVNETLQKIKIDPMGTTPHTEPEIVTWFKNYSNIDIDNVAGQEAEGLAYNIGIMKDDIPSGKFGRSS